jgi:uncharacterized protein
MTDDAWIQTFSGRAFYPLDPQVADVDLVDIAHALSQICRYAGHCRTFYSVAEHSVLLSYAVPYELRRWALLHDASEAYISDIPRPIKPHITGYAAIEDAIMRCVADRFDLIYPEPPELKEYDTRILHNERAALHLAPPKPWDIPGTPLPGITIVGLGPQAARHRFLTRANELGIR